MNRTKLTLFIIMFIICKHAYNDSKQNYYRTQEKSIISIGTSKNIPNKQDARDQAINNAFQKALTGKIESIVTKDRFSLHFKSIDQNILSKASKFIKRFTIRRQSAENDIFEAEIQLSIDEEKLKEALAANGLLFNESDYYKGLLMISIKSSQNSSPDFWWGRSIMSSDNQKIIRDIINQPDLTKPILKVDQFMLSLQNKIPNNLAKLHLDNKELQTIGNIFGIDVIYYGAISSLVNKNKFVQNKISLDLTSSLQAINVKTGRIISNTTLNGSVEISAKDIEKIEPELISKIATKTLEKSTNDIISTWINGTFNSTSYKILLTGPIGYQDYNLFKQFLKREIPSILSVEDYIISRTTKTLLFETNEKLEKVLDEIKNIPMENFQLQVQEDSDEKQLLKINLKRL